MEVGEHWAYRRNRYGKFHEVRIQAVGTKRPPRIKIQFIDDEFEGRQEWVSPTRIEVKWEELGPYAERDARWKAIEKSPQASKVEDRACWYVFAAIPEDVAQYWYSGILGMTVIYDVAKLAALSGIPEATLVGHAATIEECGETYIPWEMTVQIMRAVASRYSDVVLRLVEADERELERESILGHDMDKGWPADLRGHIPGEAVARYGEEHQKPVYALVREWAGKPAESRNELIELRRELSRVGDIAQRAVGYLRSLRSASMAAKLESELLHPPSEWRGHGLWTEPEYQTPYVWVLKSELEGLRRAHAAKAEESSHAGE